MLRITSLAAAAAILGYTSLGLAQQPSYSPSYTNRYATQPTTGTAMMPERQTLSLSRQTVPGHIKSIYRKLEVHTRGEAVFEAVQQGLIRL